jgi:mannitol-specific phosphotransferase system IIBC component
MVETEIGPLITKGPITQTKEKIMAESIPSANVKTIIFACEAGMGSSLMGVNSLKKKLKKAKVAVKVVHKPARSIPGDAQLVVVHKGLAKTVRSKAPNAVVVTFNHFLKDPAFDRIVQAFVDNTDILDG